MAASNTHFCNAATLVWGLLRLTPIISFIIVKSAVSLGVRGIPHEELDLFISM